MSKIFGERLRDLRHSKKLNQSDLAYDFNVAKNTISGWESGIREPSFDVVCDLAEYFNVTIDYLFGRDNKIPPQLDETIKLKGVARGGENINIEIKRSAIPELQRLLEEAAEQTRKDIENKK